ncbi:putative cytosolic iron-sulfur protein assembly protein 1 [Parachaetomium inaequale]|uniref:Probable cytosolic iron-sulfur protein assembly protein 1 n=1 Tax=Parachaetomium inaequale TaxID=2588326 RepID=A0AAN6SVG3_9PEZI|nr:putative cytosolic iron-sulfur protein assembly protein 1 [Parachaetomium inaequale]
MSTPPPPAPAGPAAAASQPSNPTITITPLPPFQPDLYQRAWSSTPHPTLPLLATAHAKSVTVFSLATFTKHSALTGGHARSVRTAAWQPPRGTQSKRLGLVTGSFDATAGLWSFDGDKDRDGNGGLEREVRMGDRDTEDGDGGEEEREWEFNLVLEGHENEVKSLAFSPGGQYLATSSRDKSVWIWEDVSNPTGDNDGEDDDEWETVAVLSEHDGDVKAVAWCPTHLANARAGVGRKHYSVEVLASASYDDTVRIWREDADGEWVCVAVLEGHGGTVWGLQWEGKERDDGRFPRLMTFSADGTIKVWTLRVDEEETEEGQQEGDPFRSGFGGMPNTMRRSLREEWDCTAVLPKVHTRDVYSVSWSADTGLVASTGSDGVVAVYAEKESAPEDVSMASSGAENGGAGPKSTWKVLGTVSHAHGPYEVNHITWCKRFDPGAERKGKEEMLVTTGDDGVVRPWQVRIA